MKKNNYLHYVQSTALTLMLFFGFIGSIQANLNTVINVSGGYVPGGVSTITITATINSTTVEYADAFRFVFPAGFTATVVGGNIVPGVPGCATGNGQVCQSGNTVVIGYCAFPTGGSGCGPFANGTFSFVLNVTAPLVFTNQTINWTSYGDGFLCGGGCPGCGTVTCDSGTFALSAIQCTLDCPPNISVNNTPGQCGAILTIPAPVPSSDCAGFAPGMAVLTENFNGCAQPAGWTTSFTGSSNNPALVNTPLDGCSTVNPGPMFMFGCTVMPEGGPPAPPPGFNGCVAVIDDDNPTGAGAVGNGCIISPVVNLTGLAGVNVQADFQYADLGAANFTVEYWNGAAWVIGFTQLTSGSGHINLNLLGVDNADFQVRFCHNDGGVWGWGVAFDNVVLTALLPAPPTATNNFNGGTTLVNTLFPVGTTTIVWTVLDPNGVAVTCSHTVTVVDNEPPTINCPPDVTFSLLAGECTQVYNYAVPSSDNCPGGVIPVWSNPDTINQFGAFVTVSCATGGNPNIPVTNHYYQVYEAPPGQTTAYAARLGIAPDITFNADKFHIVRLYTLNATGTPYNVSAANRTFLGQTALTIIPNGFGGQKISVPFPAGIVVPGGSRILMEVESNYPFTLAASPGTGLDTWIGSPPCGIPTDNPVTFASIGFPQNKMMFLQLQSTSGESEFVSGLESGSSFPIGTTTNCYQAVDGSGNIGTCCFNVTVLEFANPTTTLACNDNVQVSVDAECTAFISTDMILEGGPYGCYDHYLVSVQGFGSGFGGVTINSGAIGQVLTVTVTDPDTGNSCWGTITVEDKLPPTIVCTDFEIMCGESLEPNFEPVTQTAEYAAFPGLPVGPGGGVVTTSTVNANLPGNATINDVNVVVNLTHTWISDLTIRITGPGGEFSTLWNAQCGADDDLSVTFDDEGLPFNAAICPYTGGPTELLIPVSALSVFDGTNPSGTWELRITDNVGGDGGILINWALQVNYTAVLAPEFDDNCGTPTFSFTDTESGDPCDGLLITRRWTVSDASGNTATCDQLITVTPLEIENVICPPTFEGPCGGNTHPNFTGWPTVNGNEITDQNNVCNIFVGYWDKELNDCGNGVKLIRTWTVLDWCTAQAVECIQILKFSDEQAPVISCPSNITVGTDFWYCYANLSVPHPTVFDACGSAYTLSLSSSAGFVVNFGNNYVINQLPLGTHIVTWTAVDECGNVSFCTFTVTVVDDVVPVAICDHHTIVALTNDGPFGVTLIPAIVFDDGSYDNCGPVTFRARRMHTFDTPPQTSPCINFDWTTEGACIDHIPGGIPPVNSRDHGTVHRPCVPFACCDVDNGPIMVELEVRDAAGNLNFCMVEVTVQDKISPFVACPPDIIVSCDFWFNVQEGLFTDAGGNSNGNLDEDPLSAVFGNMYDAFRYNDDESVRQNIIINDPGNPTIGQPHFWGIEGWADDNCEVNLSVRVIVTADCSGDDLPANAPPGAVKLIERRFSASDGGQGIAPGTCTQRIWVVDFDPFTITDTQCGLVNADDVRWPCDIHLTNCPEGGLTPDDLESILPANLRINARPVVNDDACSLIGVTYEDTRFDFVDGACFKILRRWAVIDWCQYNSQTGFGLWYYTQVIKVHDEAGPVFVEPCVTQTLCVADDGVSLPDNNQVFLGEENPLSSSCSAHLNLSRVVTELCSDIVRYDVKIYPFNGTEFILVKGTTSAPVDENNQAILSFDTRQASNQSVRLNGIPYNSPFCGDYHRILWSAEDGCGNWSHCEYLFRLEDCKQPSPVCINGLSTVVMPVGGQVTIWAKDFNASSFDDCTPAADLLYSFSGTAYEPSFTYNCDNVPAFGVQLSVQIWVADGGTDDNCNNQISWGERNKDFCTTTIVITDNAGVCPEDTTGSILAGEILTEDIQAVELVGVSLSAPGQLFPTYVTVQDGRYNFFNVIVPNDFTIHAERNDAHKNGVSTLDLVKIQKHLLGIELMDSPYDLIAADANNDGKVRAFDLIELRKLILGIYTTLPENQSWRFVDKSFVFADPSNPWPFDEVITVMNMSSNEMDKDFVAIKVGDVNNTVKANATQVLPRNGNGIVVFEADDRAVHAGEMVEVAIRSADFTAIEGYQFTLETKGLEFRGIEGGAVSMSDENLGVFGSTLTASWHKVGGVNTTASDVLFTLSFQATTGGQLSQMLNLNSTVTEAEAYNTSADIKDLKLTFRGSTIGAEFALYQNEPNPFKGSTLIGFDLPEASHVTLTVFDVTGKVIVVKEQDAVKGYNTISVSGKELPSVGVMYYRLDANEYTATKKMIIIE